MTTLETIQKELSAASNEEERYIIAARLAQQFDHVELNSLWRSLIRSNTASANDVAAVLSEQIEKMTPAERAKRGYGEFK